MKMETIVSELFGDSLEQEKLSEKHYDEFVRLFHRLQELRDIGIIKPEEFRTIQSPMLEILMRIKNDVPSFYSDRMFFGPKKS